MLLRLDVSAQSGGTLLATLSQQEGFFPYRLDNFSSETLHVRCARLPARQAWRGSSRHHNKAQAGSGPESGPLMLGPCACSQQGCGEQEDILRPYSCLDYAWDEPSLPHQLVVSLPGNVQLGSYALDKVRASRSACHAPSCSLQLAAAGGGALRLQHAAPGAEPGMTRRACCRSAAGPASRCPPTRGSQPRSAPCRWWCWRRGPAACCPWWTWR